MGIYWIFKSIITTLRQFIMYKVMPLPVFTEEDYKAAERELKGKSKPEKKQAGERTTKSGAPVRSLHHIDDDDEPLPPPVPDPVEKEDSKTAAEEASEAEETAASNDDDNDDEKSSDE